MRIMTIASLKNGDLLFIRDSSDFSKAIIKTISTYSHVGIYFDGMIYHASQKLGVSKQNWIISLIKIIKNKFNRLSQ